MPSIAPLILCSLGALFGAAIVWLGRRGRLVDDHPLCRRCGFDLFGLPPDSGRCPECGADLSRKRARRQGHRRAYRRALIAGLMLLVLSGTYTFIGIRETARRVQWRHHTPASWLIYQTSFKDVPTRDAALAELEWRIANRKLSQRQVDSIVDRALAVQGNRAIPWLPIWGRIVEKAHETGKLPREKWTQYARQAVVIEFTVRKKATRKDGLPIHFAPSPARVGDRAFYINIADYRSFSAIPETGLPAAPLSGRQSFRWMYAGPPSFQAAQFVRTNELTARFQRSTWRLDGPVDRKIANGPQTAALMLSLQVYDFTFAARPRTSPLQQSRQRVENGEAPLVSMQVTLTAPWTLVPPEQPTVQLKADPVLRAAIRRALTPRYKHFLNWTRTDWLGFSNMLAPSPTDYAFDVLVRYGGDEFTVGTLTCFGGEITLSPAGRPPDGLPYTVDLIFRPNPSLAAQAVEGTEIWGEDVVFLRDTIDSR